MLPWHWLPLVVVVVCFKQMHQFTRETLFGFGAAERFFCLVLEGTELLDDSHGTLFCGCWRSIKINDFLQPSCGLGHALDRVELRRVRVQNWFPVIRLRLV